MGFFDEMKREIKRSFLEGMKGEKIDDDELDNTTISGALADEFKKSMADSRSEEDENEDEDDIAAGASVEGDFTDILIREKMRQWIVYSETSNQMMLFDEGFISTAEYEHYKLEVRKIYDTVDIVGSLNGREVKIVEINNYGPISSGSEIACFFININEYEYERNAIGQKINLLKPYLPLIEKMCRYLSGRLKKLDNLFIVDSVSVNYEIEKPFHLDKVLNEDVLNRGPEAVQEAVIGAAENAVQRLLSILEKNVLGDHKKVGIGARELSKLSYDSENLLYKIQLGANVAKWNKVEDVLKNSCGMSSGEVSELAQIIINSKGDSMETATIEMYIAINDFHNVVVNGSVTDIAAPYVKYVRAWQNNLDAIARA